MWENGRKRSIGAAQGGNGSWEHRLGEGEKNRLISKERVQREYEETDEGKVHQKETRKISQRGEED